MHDAHHPIDLPSLRKQKILLLLERDGKVTASELVEHFAVSQDTIRRDLGELAAAQRHRQRFFHAGRRDQ